MVPDPDGGLRAGSCRFAFPTVCRTETQEAEVKGMVGFTTRALGRASSSLNNL